MSSAASRLTPMLLALTLLATVADATTAPASSGRHEFEAVQMVRTQITLARNWVLASFDHVDVNGANVAVPRNDDVMVRAAMGDCAELYGEAESMLEPLVSVGNSNMSYSRDDAVTWLSAALANHRSCVDGLGERGLDITVVDRRAVAAARNLTALIGKALALYAHSSGTPSKPAVSTTRRANYSGIINNGGLLTSWTAATSKADIIVAKDGSGTHRSINDAVEAAARAGRSGKHQQRLVMYVKAGVYNERVAIPKHLRNLMVVGDGIDRTIVTGSRNVPDGSTTYNSATFGVSGDGFWARDITFENTAGPQKHQAVALRVNSDHAVFYRCSFRGYQDTLFLHSLRQFYRDCHIYGTIDFIFGDASAVLQNCDIFARKPMRHQANHVTAQGREDPNENTGISIQGSRIRPAPDLARSGMGSTRSYLGRPWKEYSRTVVWDTDLDGLIDPKGWNEWRGSFALSTLYYAEFRNTGSGAGTRGRVQWPGFHVLTRPEQVGDFTVSRFIHGDAWIPASGVPFQLGA